MTETKNPGIKPDIVARLHHWRSQMPELWYGNADIDDAIAEIERLRAVCSQVYQVASTHGASAAVLDQLYAASAGDPLPHESLLPYEPPAQIHGERAALEHWLGCWEAAEAEGLTNALHDAKNVRSAAAERLADLVERRIAHGVDRAREALARAQADARPVAQWQWRWKGDEEWRNSTEENCKKAEKNTQGLFEVRPLYTHPAPEAAQALSDGEILDLWCSTPRQAGTEEEVVSFARAILTRASATTVAEPSEETEQEVEADAYRQIARRISHYNSNLHSVQEYIGVMCDVIQECADFFHDFAPASDGGDDEAVRIAANLRALMGGKLEKVEAAQQQAEPVGDEHYDEVKCTLKGAHKIMESLSAIERRVGPVGSHARGYAHKITNALKHLDQMRAAQSSQRTGMSIDDVLMVRDLMQRGMLVPDTPEGWRAALEPFATQSGQRAGMAEDARAVADALEAEYLAVANGEKKPAKIALEPLVRAVEAIRKLAAAPTPAAQGGV